MELSDHIRCELLNIIRQFVSDNKINCDYFTPKQIPCNHKFAEYLDLIRSKYPKSFLNVYSNEQVYYWIAEMNYETAVLYFIPIQSHEFYLNLVKINGRCRYYVPI